MAKAGMRKLVIEVPEVVADYLESFSEDCDGVSGVSSTVVALVLVHMETEGLVRQEPGVH